MSIECGLYPIQRCYLGEPLYLLDENPTAENLARHIHDVLSRQGLALAEVRLWETPSSYATYRVG